jgi:hypothetical protein
MKRFGGDPELRLRVNNGWSTPEPFLPFCCALTTTLALSAVHSNFLVITAMTWAA